MGPILTVVGRPEHIDSASWVGRSNERGGLRVGSAGHSLVHSAFDGASVTDLTDGRAWDGLSSGDGALVGLSINGDVANNTVGLSKWEKHKGNKGEGGEQESRGLHCC